MNIVFGSLVGEFNGYFAAGTSVTEADFKASVSRLRSEAIQMKQSEIPRYHWLT